MSYQDAVKDGIRMGNTDLGTSNYIIPCSVCGNDLMSWSYISGKKYRCKDCKNNEMRNDKNKNTPIKQEKQLKKVENAISRIRLQGNNLEDYKLAIEKIKTDINNGNYFDSTEEIMTAIQLEKEGIEYNHHVKMGRYETDFLIPSMNIVLEVDGTLFHTDSKKKQEQLRDGLILLNLGAKWEVIRIYDTYINQNISQLLKAITKIKNSRERQRTMNNGQLPKGYSNKAI